MHCSALSLSSLSLISPSLLFFLFHFLSSLCTLSLPLLIMINVQQRLCVCVCVYDCVHVCGVCLPEAEMKLKQLLTPPTAPLP